MSDDAEWMSRFQAGDKEAYNKLVSLYYPMIYNYFCSMTYDKHLAEDITQEVFIKLYKFRDQYQPVKTFKAFLFTIARNAYIDYYRKVKRKPEFSYDVDVGEKKYSDLFESENSDPSEPIDASERIERIMNAVHKLPDILRDVFVLSEIEGLKYSEIAEILNIPVGTVKSRMFNALKNLRELLKGLVSYEL